MDDRSLQKFKNLIAATPKAKSKWTSLPKDSEKIVKMKNTVKDFLKLMSGGEVSEMLVEVLSEDERELLPDSLRRGKRRLEKLNNAIQRSPPLKSWTRRSVNDSNRLEIEVVARRMLAYLSGGQLIPLLHDILYPEEKDLLSEKYRIALIRIGEVIKHINPKSKAIVLNAVRQAGFSKEDLRDKGWFFSTNLWDSGMRDPSSRQFRTKRTLSTMLIQEEEELDEASTLQRSRERSFSRNERFCNTRMLESASSNFSSEFYDDETRNRNPIFPQLRLS